MTADLGAIVAQRRALGQDRFDEVWEGEYRMVPGPRIAHGYVDNQLGLVLEPFARTAGLIGVITVNIGAADDYRVPDRGYFRGLPPGLYTPTAQIVVEVLSPGDETFHKFGFYAAHGVHEIIVADPDTATVQIHVLNDGDGRDGADDTVDGERSYTRTDRSDLLDLTAAELVAAVDWP
jgi:Uma2 family endonuclease